MMSSITTLVLAGGVPPENNLRLFDRARVIVFHGGAVIHGDSITEKRLRFTLPDFDEEGGFNSNFAAMRSFLTLNGYGRPVVFSAWRRAGEQWTGSVELIRLEDELHMEILPDSDAALLAFRVFGTEVTQVEVSDDLISWQPLGEPVVGDGNVHCRVCRLGTATKRYFRTQKWLKP